MHQGIQTFLAEAGESGCYSLSILRLAEGVSGESFDVEKTLVKAIELGFIYYNEKDQNDNNNFFVSKPDAFLSWLTGRKYEVRHEADINYQPKQGELVVQRWERVQTGITRGHFRLPDWDSLYDSQTVKFGKIVSLRVFKEL